MSPLNDLPSDDTVRKALDVVAPSYISFTIHPLEGSYSNHTHLVKVEFGDQPTQQIVLRRYNEANGDCVGKARREFYALTHLDRHGFPAPKPLYLDDSGQLFGSPGIITAFVGGRQIEMAVRADDWRDKIDIAARTLARIHSTPFEKMDNEVLMNGNEEVVWFLKRGEVPQYMKNHPDGLAVWHLVAEFLPQIQVAKPVLLHIDFWSGNILWDDGQISAVVDWEEAAFGDAGIDVAYFCMELCLEGLEDEAEQFLQVYEKTVGHPVANLGVWEMAAAVRPMLDPTSWFTRPLMEERFRRFIGNAKARVTG
jgi:aminoglycoside phosphotransferase (APT) family kinase protein